MTLGEVVSIYYHNLRGVDIGVFYGDEKTNDQLCEDYLVNALRLIRTARKLRDDAWANEELGRQACGPIPQAAWSCN